MSEVESPVNPVDVVVTFDYVAIKTTLNPIYTPVCGVNLTFKGIDKKKISIRDLEVLISQRIEDSLCNCIFIRKIEVFRSC